MDDPVLTYHDALRHLEEGDFYEDYDRAMTLLGLIQLLVKEYEASVRNVSLLQTHMTTLVRKNEHLEKEVLETRFQFSLLEWQGDYDRGMNGR